MYQRSICKLLLRHRPFSRSRQLISFSSSAAPTTTLPNSPAPHFVSSRHFSGGGDFDQNKEVDRINRMFGEAREEIESAMESKETVYFDEEALCARNAVDEVLDSFQALLAKLPEDKRAALQRSMGLKIEQLKAEIQQLND